MPKKRLLPRDENVDAGVSGDTPAFTRACLRRCRMPSRLDHASEGGTGIPDGTARGAVSIRRRIAGFPRLFASALALTTGIMLSMCAALALMLAPGVPGASGPAAGTV